MASLPIRDPVGDHLLTPQNAALVVIDYQPSQFGGVRSMDRDLLLENIVSTVKTAKAFDMPPASSGSSKREPVRSAGSRSRLNSSATGHAKKRWQMSSTSCSPKGC
jgi:nicotinamidase-related amidase